MEGRALHRFSFTSQPGVSNEPAGLLLLTKTKKDIFVHLNRAEIK